VKHVLSIPFPSLFYNGKTGTPTELVPIFFREKYVEIRELVTFVALNKTETSIPCDVFVLYSM
jgi:hypothetical protein